MRVIELVGFALVCGVASAFQPVADVAPAPKPAPPKWDISNPTSDGTNGGWAWKDAALNTDEGTWISLDVSPDGSTIVFDLLGDIYTMPIAGSEDGTGVKCIAEGLQWDMQPRFSPDGKRVAFVSDRSAESGKGGDNIWTMNTDGTDPRQVTKEDFRLLTQPVWTPDGKSIIARKHFTSRRSLGAGEMWLYDASGKTDGVQLTAKQSEQKDTGEPAVSADGRFLYYSLDATGSPNFEYDKDSNPGIYAIDRLDMKSQQTERIVAGPGGACRPTPSPDGKQLAFVRRVRYQTELFVMDLASGESRAVYGKLERDMQETWAVHGVYPAMAWTPDGGSIVFWAEGKIRRVDVTSGQSRVIPFAVTNPRKVANALRFPIEVAPETFDVKMLQSVQVSPKGDRAIFQALGRLHLCDLIGSEPKRLTDATDEFEFYPAWSRDGAQLVYVAWNDDRLATVRVMDLASGKSAAVTTEPGHYTDPVFSPDGSTIVFSRTGGGYLTSPLWSRNGGIYAATNPLAPGNPAPSMRRISTRGGSPQFGVSSDRLFLTVREGGSDSDKVSLISIPLGTTVPGEAERTHYKSDWATEFRVSPDGASLAFAERYSVFVTPFMDTGKAI
ncbi:MAG: amidohydrolase, partial [Phycisphaerales bacterium]